MNRKLQFLVTVVSLMLVGVLLLGAANKGTSSPEETYRHIGVFAEVLSKIKSDYVEEPDMKNVTLGAMNGLLESLDPYASYLSADQYKQYQKTKTDAKGWTGLLLAKRFGYIAIIDSVPGSPADKVGLSTGDMLETIQGVNTRDMPLAYAEMMLLGDIGTTVVLRFRSPEPTKMSIVRGPIQWPAVTSKMMSDGIGYVQVPTLEGKRVSDVAAAVQAIEKQGAKKIVLDLRNCASGAPESGIALANLFIDKGRLGYSTGQKSPRQNYEADPAKAITKLPLTVMTNRGTAGAAEIAANAFSDLRRGEIVGERTYADAGIRRPIVLDDGSAVILSVAKFYNAEDKALQEVAVQPSVPVVDNDPGDTGEEGAEDAPKKEEKPKSTEDAILKKALEVAIKGLTPEETKTAETIRALGKKKAEEGTGLGPLNVPTPK
jgi:carboxyl-terminal processing protease